MNSLDAGFRCNDESVLFQRSPNGLGKPAIVRTAAGSVNEGGVGRGRVS